MYARILRYRCDPSRLDELIAKTDEFKAEVKAIAGLVDVYSAWRADGTCVTMAMYESQAAADAASAQVQAIWGSVAEFLESAPEVETYENIKHITA